MQRTILTIMLVCSTSYGCTREDEHLGVQAPTAWSSGPVPPVDIKNGAPLNNAAGYPEQARVTIPKEHESEFQADSERTAYGTFTAASGRKLAGEVQLQEVSESVQLTFEVNNAQPGTRRVVVTNEADCAQLPTTIHAVPTDPGAGIGALAIDESGRAHSTLSVPRATLQRDAPNSLLGKTVVLYAPERIAGSRAGKEVPIACAPVRDS